MLQWETVTLNDIAHNVAWGDLPKKDKEIAHIYNQNLF
jgi:hypothetical protein